MKRLQSGNKLIFDSLNSDDIALNCYFVFGGTMEQVWMEEHDIALLHGKVDFGCVLRWHLQYTPVSLIGGSFVLWESMIDRADWVYGFKTAYAYEFQGRQLTHRSQWLRLQEQTTLRQFGQLDGRGSTRYPSGLGVLKKRPCGEVC